MDIFGFGSDYPSAIRIWAKDWNIYTPSFGSTSCGVPTQSTHAHPLLRRDKELLRKVLPIHGSVLCHTDVTIRSDRELVRMALSSPDPLVSLEFVCGSVLRDDHKPTVPTDGGL